MIQLHLQQRSSNNGSSHSSHSHRERDREETVVDLDALEAALESLPQKVHVIVDCASFNGQSITLKKEVDPRTELVVVGSQAAGREENSDSDVSACGFFWLLIGITFQVYCLVTTGMNLGHSVKLGWDIMTIFLHLWNLTTVVILINALQEKNYERLCEVCSTVKCFAFLFIIYCFVWSTRTLKANFFEVFQTRDVGPRIINISESEPFQFSPNPSEADESIFCYPPGSCEVSSVVVFGSIGVAILGYFAYYMCFLKMALKARNALKPYEVEHIHNLEMREVI